MTTAEITLPTPPVLARAMRERTRLRHGIAVRVALAVLVALFLWIISPFWGWLTLAAWFAAAVHPLLRRLAAMLGGRHRAAAAITVLLFVAVTVPIGALVASLAADATAPVGTMLASGSGSDSVRSLVTPDAEGQVQLDGATLTAVLQQHGERALEVASSLAGSAGRLFFGLFVFFTAAFVMLADGGRALAWLELLAPTTRAHLHRLRDAFLETGRGLFVGAGLTGLVQASIATIAYFALGVPRALVLGVLTLATSAIPGFATAIVWVPVSIGLALSGRLGAGIALAVIGTLLISGIDSFIRPFFVRLGRLDLHPFIVLISIFGGLLLVGPWGLILGPLVARLTVEVLRIAQEEGIV